jgi:hypothetical protein
MQMRFLILGIALAGLVIGGLVWLRSQPSTPAPAPQRVTDPVPDVAPVPVPPPVEPTPQVAVPEQPPETALPVLDSSDDFVRTSVLEAAPELAAWLDREELVRRFAVVLDNASRGDYPRRQLGFLAPQGAFPVRREDGAGGPGEDQQLFLDPAGYARYDAFVGLATSVEPAPAAALLIELSPLLVDALQELGLRGPDARSLLVNGIDQALATPVLESEVELLQSTVLYEYADPALESLPPMQKQLLRMGPDNLDRLQGYLRELRAELTAFPESD